MTPTPDSGSDSDAAAGPLCSQLDGDAFERNAERDTVLWRRRLATASDDDGPASAVARCAAVDVGMPWRGHGGWRTRTRIGLLGRRRIRRRAYTCDRVRLWRRSIPNTVEQNTVHTYQCLDKLHAYGFGSIHHRFSDAKLGFTATRHVSPKR